MEIERKDFIKEIENLIDKMYQNKISEAYTDFSQCIPKVQEICNEVLEKSGNNPEMFGLIKKLISNMTDAYNNSDIITLADVMEYGLLDLVYLSAGKKKDNICIKQEKESSTGIWEKNLSALQIGKNYLYDGIEFDRQKAEEENSKIRPFVSKISPEYAASRWIKRFEEIKEFSVLFIFGFSDGTYIKTLLKQCNDTNKVLVYEPSLQNFRNVLKKKDMQDLLYDSRLVLLVKGINDGYMSEYISMLIDYGNRFLSEFYCLPNYDVSYPEDAKKYQDSIQYEIEMCEFTKNLAVLDADKLTKNLIHNVFDRIGQYHVQQLKEKFGKMGIADVPAILVSAGPSLDKNIKQIKKAVGKAFIVVVDAALKAMVANEIPFDIGVTADPRKELSLFENDRIYEVPMLVDNYSTVGFVKKHKGKRFYADNSNEFLQNYIKNLNKNEERKIKEYENVILAAGGSVANYAFSFVRYLGFRTIILVGQDLAFTGGRGHNKSVYESEKKNREHVTNSPSICEVEDIYGGKVKTDAQMASYIKWFEKEIYKYKDSLKVIDATEGGAKIQGSQVMTLDAAIGQFCRQEFCCRNVIEGMDMAYDSETRQYLEKKLHKLSKELKEMRQMLCENIKNYEKLALADIGDTAKLIQEIDRMNESIQENPLFYLLEGYNQQVEYEISENVYNAEEGEISVIAKKGTYLLEGYMNASDMLEKDLKEHYENTILSI